MIGALRQLRMYDRCSFEFAARVALHLVQNRRWVKPTAWACRLNEVKSAVRARRARGTAFAETPSKETRDE
jgi:hypothetical protein